MILIMMVMIVVIMKVILNIIDRALEAKSTGDLSSLVEEQRLQKTEEEGEETTDGPVLPATEPPKRKNFRTDMGSSAPPGKSLRYSDNTKG